MRRGKKSLAISKKHTVDSPINRKHSARRPVKRKHSAKVASERKAFLCIEANQLNALCLVLGLMHLQQNRLEAAHEQTAFGKVAKHKKAFLEVAIISGWHSGSGQPQESIQ